MNLEDIEIGKYYLCSRNFPNIKYPDQNIPPIVYVVDKRGSHLITVLGVNGMKELLHLNWLVGPVSSVLRELL